MTCSLIEDQGRRKERRPQRRYGLKRLMAVQGPAEMAGVVERSWWDRLVEYRLLDGSDYIQGEDLSWVRSPHEPEVTNNIFGSRLAEKGLDDRIESALAPYGSRNLPVNWWIGPSCRPRDLNRRLAQHGFILRFFLAGMWLDLSRAQERRPSPPGLEIREVAEEGDLVRLVEAIGRSFTFSGDFLNHLTGLYRVLSFGPGTKWRHLIGLVEGEVAGSASVELEEGVATLINVGVRQEMRRRGLGTALTRAALDLARGEGQRLMVLQSTLPGRALYEKLGFEATCLLSAYSRPTAKGWLRSAR